MEQVQVGMNQDGVQSQQMQPMMMQGLPVQVLQGQFPMQAATAQPQIIQLGNNQMLQGQQILLQALSQGQLLQGQQFQMQGQNPLQQQQWIFHPQMQLLSQGQQYQNQIPQQQQQLFFQQGQMAGHMMTLPSQTAGQLFGQPFSGQVIQTPDGQTIIYQQPQLVQTGADNSGMICNGFPEQTGQQIQDQNSTPEQIQIKSEFPIQQQSSQQNQLCKQEDTDTINSEDSNNQNQSANNTPQQQQQLMQMGATVPSANANLQGMNGQQLVQSGVPLSSMVSQSFAQSMNMNNLLAAGQQLIQTPNGLQIVTSGMTSYGQLIPQTGMAQMSQNLQGIPNVNSLQGIVSSSANVFQAGLPQGSLGQVMQAAGIQTSASVAPVFSSAQSIMSPQIVQSNGNQQGVPTVQGVPTSTGLQQVIQSGIQTGSVIQLTGGSNGQPVVVVNGSNLQKIPSSAPQSTEEEPLYVNAKQYHRILKRRQARAKLEASGKIPKERRKYLHESRHKHAMNRSRGDGGRFFSGIKTEPEDPDVKLEPQDYAESETGNYYPTRTTELRALAPAKPN